MFKYVYNDNILNCVERIMAEKNKFVENFKRYLFYSIVAFVLSFIVASVLVTYMSQSDVTIKDIIKNFTNQNTIFWGLIIFAISFLFVILMKPVKTSSALKGKDKMENQRFLRDNELDGKFKHCMFTELSSFSHVGVPFRAERKKNNIRIHFTPDCHVLIVGASGTGKTTAFIDPAIQIIGRLKNKPSLFVTDVKGELYSHHSQMLKDQGYRLLTLDLNDPYNSTQWNPLEHIYDEWQRQLHLEEEILRHTNDNVKNYKFPTVGQVENDEWYEFDGKAFASLKDALLEVEVNKAKIRDDCFDSLSDIATAIVPIENEKDKSWEQGAHDYFLAILIAMLEDSENESLRMTRERYNFFNAYKIAMNKDNDFEDVKQYFSGRSPLSKTRQLSSNITQTNAKTTRDGYMSTLNTKLSMFADGGICFVTAKNEIDFFNIDEQPTAFFIKVPDEKASRYALASVCISQAYKQFVAKARANEKTTGEAHLKRPLLYMMDEFANIPKVADLDKIITVSRSRWIYLNMAIQSYSQLENVYGKEVASIVRGNCKATVFYGTPDLQTRKEFSDELGSYTIETSSVSTPEKKGKDSGGKSTSTQLQTVPLVYASDLDKIPLGENITKMFQSYPIKGIVTPYFKTKDIYTDGAYNAPFIPGRRLNEQEVFYDITRRNKIVLTYDDE